MDMLLEIEPAKPMLYAGFYPFHASEHRSMKQALERLCINDASVVARYMCVFVAHLYNSPNYTVLNAIRFCTLGDKGS